MKKVEHLPVASALGMLGFVATADAFSIVNRDAEPHNLTIREGNDQREVSVEPYGRAGGLCSSICNVTIDDGPNSYELALDDAMSIEVGEWLTADEPIDDPTEVPPEEPT